MAATVLGKSAVIPLFAITGTLAAGTLVINDPRITVNMLADVQYFNNGAAPVNGGQLDVTIAAGVVTVRSSNGADANNILVRMYEGTVP